MLGVDVSFWEPVIDWNKLLQQNYDFTFIKCSQSLFSDPKFKEHWGNAKAAGMPRGAYHFYSPVYKSATPEAQAEFFFKSLGNDLGELPFVVDLEGFTTGYYHGGEYWYRYLERLNQLSGNFPVIIYTAYYYFKDNVIINPVQDVRYFGKYPLWIANYGVEHPLIPYPWTNWLFWQHTESQLIDGVYDELGRKTECDIDLFNGNEEDFKDILVSQPTPPQENPMDYVELTPSVAGEYRSIRLQTDYPNVPHIAGAKTGQINAGSTGKALPGDRYIYAFDATVLLNGVTYQAKAGDTWYRVYESGGSPISGWVAQTHMGRIYLNVRLVSDSTPEPEFPPEVILKIGNIEKSYVPKL